MIGGGGGEGGDDMLMMGVLREGCQWRVMIVGVDPGEREQ